MLGRRSFTLSLLSLVTASAVCPVPVVRAWAADRGPDTFIREMGHEAINSLTGKELSDNQREEKFRSILNRVFATDELARFTLGRYWRLATEQQKGEFKRLFEDFIVQAYAVRFRDYDGETFSVGKVHDTDDRDKLVQSVLTRKDGSRIPVQWRVRSDNGYKVVDVLVEGVSMAITHREEFAAIISQNGGKIDGLLAALREKTGRQ